MTFLSAILNKSKKHEFPFDHWEYSGALSDESVKEITNADIPDVGKHNLSYDGTRAIDGGAAEFRKGIASGGKAIKFRCFVTKENASQFPNLVKLINELQSKETYQTISKMIKNTFSAYPKTPKSILIGPIPRDLDDKNPAVTIPRRNFRSPKGPFIPGNTPVWTASRYGGILECIT